VQRAARAVDLADERLDAGVEVVGALLAGLALGRGRVRRIGWAIPLAAVSVLAIAGVSGEGRRMEERVATVLDWRDHDPNVYRLIETRNALQTIQERPWWGGGLGAKYRGDVSLRRSAHVPIPTLVHNNLLWLAFFWEVTTLCCWGLIRHDGTPIAATNALRALWMCLLGSLGFSLSDRALASRASCSSSGRAGTGDTESEVGLALA